MILWANGKATKIKTITKDNILFKFEAAVFSNPQQTIVCEDFKNTTTKKVNKRLA